MNRTFDEWRNDQFRESNISREEEDLVRGLATIFSDYAALANGWEVEEEEDYDDLLDVILGEVRKLTRQKVASYEGIR